MAKRLKTHHDLARQLWARGDSAALLICRPKAFGEDELDTMLRESRTPKAGPAPAAARDGATAGTVRLLPQRAGLVAGPQVGHGVADNPLHQRHFVLVRVGQPGAGQERGPPRHQPAQHRR